MDVPDADRSMDAYQRPPAETRWDESPPDDVPVTPPPVRAASIATGLAGLALAAFWIDVLATVPLRDFVPWFVGVGCGATMMALVAAVVLPAGRIGALVAALVGVFASLAAIGGLFVCAVGGAVLGVVGVVMTLGLVQDDLRSSADILGAFPMNLSVPVAWLAVFTLVILAASGPSVVRMARARRTREVAL